MMLRATAIGILAIAAVAVGLLAPWALPVVVIILVSAVSAAARHVSSLFSQPPEPPPPSPMPILEPLVSCPGCGVHGAPQAWLEKTWETSGYSRVSGWLWVLRCWECGYEWPQGDTWKAWHRLRDSRRHRPDGES